MCLLNPLFADFPPIKGFYKAYTEKIVVGPIDFFFLAR